jgi:hypothetical protein
MMRKRKQNAPKHGGVRFTKLAGGVKKQTIKKFVCGVQHTSKLRRELEAAGLGLKDANGLTQRQTLLMALEYLGNRGMNTLEGIACGFLRITTRINELKLEGYNFDTIKESAIGADGLMHSGIARYIYKGRKPHDDPQKSLDLGGLM